MPNIEIKKTEYYNCPYCHRIIPNYAICNCVKIYNQTLDNVDNIITEQLDKSDNQVECQTLRWVLDVLSDLIK